MDLLDSHRFADDLKAKEDVIASMKKLNQVPDGKDPLYNARNTVMKEAEKKLLLSPANNKMFVTQHLDNSLTRFAVNLPLDDASETYPIGPKTSEMGRDINQLAAEATFSHWRWPPYVLLLSALVVVLSHALHCALVVLATALPYLRYTSTFATDFFGFELFNLDELGKFSTFLWNWSEERLGNIMEAKFVERSITLLLCVTTFGACLVFYLAYAAYALLLWLVQPLWTHSEAPIDIDYSSNKITSEGSDTKKMKLERSMEKSISNHQS